MTLAELLAEGCDPEAYAALLRWIGSEDTAETQESES